MMKKRLTRKVFGLVLVLTLLLGSSQLTMAADDNVQATLTDNSSGTSLNFRVDYSAPEISAGDKIVITMTPSVSGKIKIQGFADNTPIYNDANEEVGTRTFTYGADGSCTLTIIFNDAYDGQNNITGWYAASASIQYIETVIEESVNIKVQIDGEQDFITKPVPPGDPGSGPGGTDFSPGPGFSKNWRYGDKSGNQVFQDITADGDYTKLDTMRWYLPIGVNNLTNRDMRASEGDTFWTTPESIAYSNNNPSPASPYDRYNTVNEPYLKYWYWAGDVQHNYTVDEPFHYTDVALDDYLDVDENYGTLLCSPHEYVKDSIRIIRVIGRDQSVASSFINIADSNFIKEVAKESDEIYRFPGESPFPGYRGLTVEEFFDQMKAEGQFSQYTNWEDLITFDLVNNRVEYFPEFTSEGDPNVQIPHFKLTLGDLRFNDSYSGTVKGIKQNGTEWATVSAENLPYAYIVYYDTKATGIELDAESNFRFFNRATLSHNEVKVGTDIVPLPMKYEASGGTGNATLKIKKINGDNEILPGITFTLSGDGGYMQERTTGDNGTISYIINSLGVYTLTETVPSSMDLVPIEPITFTVTQADIDSGIVNLQNLLPGNYTDGDDISFADNTNTIVNYKSPTEETESTRPSIPGEPDTSDASKTSDNQVPEDPSSSDHPQTGDSSNMILWLSICALALIVIIAALVVKKKAKR